MKNKTKAQLIKALTDLKKHAREVHYNNTYLSNKLKETNKNKNNNLNFLKTSHKKIKHLKSIIKRDAKGRRLINLHLIQSNEVLKSKANYLKSELRAQKKINEINEQALVSCENANNDLHAVNRYLEMRVSDLTIQLNEVHNEQD